MAVDGYVPLTMAAYGCARTWDPAYSANHPSSNLNGCRSTYPQNPPNTYFLLQWLYMAVRMYPLGH
eukprot:2991138-Pyramimonas_sp.AAC.1